MNILSSIIFQHLFTHPRTSFSIDTLVLASVQTHHTRMPPIGAMAKVTIIATINVNGHKVTIVNVPFVKMDAESRKKFIGQKMHSPWWVDRDTQLYGLKSADEEMQTEEMLYKWDHFELKHDGSCGALVWDGEQFIAYARFDIKQRFGKKIIDGDPFKVDIDTTNWIPCEPRPKVTDDVPQKHWPHMRPISEDPKMYKHYVDAFNNTLPELMEHVAPRMKVGQMITVEYMGEKFNKPSYEPVGKSRIVLHGSLRVNIPPELRNFDGFKAIFTAFPIIEGVIGYPPNGAAADGAAAVETPKPFKIKACYMGINPEKSDLAAVLAEHKLDKIPTMYAAF